MRCVAKRLGRGTEGAKETASHSLAIAESRLASNFLDWQPALFEHVLTIANDLGAATAAAAASLVGAVPDHYGKIDILVNNAGTVWGASAIEHSPEA